MRIVFVTNNYTPYSGGVVSSIQATTDGLRSRGHEVLIISLDFLGKAHDDPDYVFRVFSPIRFFYKKNHMAIPWRPTHVITQLIKSYSPDVVHVHHPFLLGVSGLYAARSLGIPCVFTYHTLYQQYAHYIPVPEVLTQSLIAKTVDMFCTAVDGIVAPSSAIREHVRSRGVIAPVEVIPSALRLNFLSTDGRVELPEARQFFELLIVSRFVQEKNIPFVFDVFKLLPDNVRLTLVGYGTEYESMQKLAYDTLALPRERVRFIHKPASHDLLTLYRSSDLFIFPSRTDTQGLVMVEAMSQGLPVIALDGFGQRDVIEQGVNGFIIENDYQAADVIIAIMKNAVAHKKLIVGAYATAHNYYPDCTISKLLDFYSMVLG